MISWLDCLRVLHSRNLGIRLTWDMLLPIFMQPALVLVLSIFSEDSILLVSIIIGGVLLAFRILAGYKQRSQIFYYWTTSSITYVIIAFENVVVPLAEITIGENFVLIVCSGLALLFIYFTKSLGNQLGHASDYCALQSSDAINCETSTDVCAICRQKKTLRSYHCQICQVCIPQYDYHCYWLNSCIGEGNLQFFFLALIFSMISLGFASLLILTTICEPEFYFGILLPQDCTDVSADIGTLTCFVCGIYCMELAVVLLIQLIHQIWLISKGLSALEWSEQFKYSLCKCSPYSRGFIGNWLNFVKTIKKATI